MSTNLKFRGKEKVFGNWWFVAMGDEDYWEQFWRVVDLNTVGLCMDITDKEGTEIYDGDLLLFNFREGNDKALADIREVKFGEGSAMGFCEYEHTYVGFYIHPVIEFEEISSYRDFVVIGNIHDTSSQEWRKSCLS